jgi:protein involved in temperature-dependent protein secretion
MEQADQLLKAGDLAGARAALVQDVRERPQDERARMFLFQLLLVTAEWDKAESQLRALAQLSPEAQILATVYSQAIGAEKIRAQAFAGAAPCPVLIDSGPWMEKLIRAFEAFARGAAGEGETLRGEAFEIAPETPGQWDDTPFGQLADCDGRFGPALEAIVGGRWGLIGFDAISKIVCEGPKDLRDVVWLPVEMSFRTGQSAAAFLPVRYPGTETAADDQLKLGRATIWRDGPSGQEGLGQRLWFLDDGAERGILSLRHVAFS